MSGPPVSPWPLAALSAAAIALPAPVWAQDAYAFNIPAGPLDRALATVSGTTGVSIGSTEPLSGVRAPSVSGRLTPLAAVRRLLAGSSFDAVVSGRVIRIVRRRIRPAPPPAAQARPPARARPSAPPARPRPPPIQSPEVPDEVTGTTIIVTATKRVQATDDVPLALSIVSPGDLNLAQAAPGTAAIAAVQPQMTLAEIGPGQNRLFLRGVADSPFNGPSQSTVAIQLDEARSTYDAPDPDLALVDVERVEILSGPQGPLYGTGALGGVMRIVTAKPDLGRVTGSITASGRFLSGSVGGGGSAVANVPVLPDRLGLRAVAYAERQPGWIRTGDRDDSNGTTVSGLRGAVRGRIGRWTLDAGGVDQSIAVRDTQYVFARQSRSRPAQPRESSDNDFRQLTGTAAGPLLGLRATLVGSVVRHDIGTRLTRSPTANPTALFDDERAYSLSTQEFRLTGSDWFAGVSRLTAQSRRRAGAIGSVDAPQLSSDEDTTEVALFGEGSIALSTTWRLTGGARVYRTAIDDELLETSQSISHRRRKTGMSPSLALAWRPPGGGIVFARAAHALRTGALNPTDGGDVRRVSDDSVRVVELGTRLPITPRVSVTANASYTDWRDVQSDVLTLQGLIATRNVGRAQIPSLSLTADWQGEGWFAAGAMLLQRPRLRQPLEEGEDEDLRLPVVPDMAASVRGGWQGDGRQIGVSARVSGSSRLSFDPRLDREIGELLDVAAFASARVGRWTASARIDNLLGGRADRLGYGNGFALLDRPQYVPQVPRSFSLSVTRAFGATPER